MNSLAQRLQSISQEEIISKIGCYADQTILIKQELYQRKEELVNFARGMVEEAEKTSNEAAI